MIGSDMVKARERLWKAQERLRCFPALNVEINGFAFNLKRRELGLVDGDNFLGCFLSDEDLDRVLTRKLHWNNAELGFRVLFDRKPNVYSPETHLLLSFFHM